MNAKGGVDGPIPCPNDVGRKATFVLSLTVSNLTAELGYTIPVAGDTNRTRFLLLFSRYLRQVRLPRILPPRTAMGPPVAAYIRRGAADETTRGPKTTDLRRVESSARMSLTAPPAASARG